MATTIILYSTPVFFLLILVELIINKFKGLGLYRFNDAITSLSLGIISQTKRLVFLGLATYVYAYIESLSGLPRLPKDSIATWIFAFIFYDLLYYWFHRTSHSINFLWASHVVHHQSEEYNLTTALRQTSSSVFGWLFYIPSFLVGIPSEVFFVCGALNLVYQFWVHTQVVGQLGWLEYLLVTPSHHRVHHGQNPEYIDKNHGGVFIVWDKLFGTFQQELMDRPVVYGVRKQARGFNPLWLNFQIWIQLFKDAWQTKSWFDKLRIWFMPTGWRPSDRQAGLNQNDKFVAPEKYNPKSNAKVKGYILFQYTLALAAALLFIIKGNQFNNADKAILWIMITLPLVTNGILLEMKNYAVKLEAFRLFLTLGLVGYSWGTFLSNQPPYQGYFVIAYFLISLLALLVTKNSVTETPSNSLSENSHLLAPDSRANQ